jgi:transketolase
VFTRQKTAPQPRDESTLANVERGGYVLRAEPAGADPALVIIATGSEVALAMEAAEVLASGGIHARVVSMPCTDVFLSQDQRYRDAVLPPALRARVAVEAGHPDYWRKFVGLDGDVVGIDRFGLSAPGDAAMAAMGMTAGRVVEAARGVLARIGGDP